MATPWDARFERVLRAALPKLAGDGPLDPDACLPGAGLDSLATIEILLTLEDAYRISVPDEDLTSGTFATPASLWAVLQANGAADGTAMKDAA